MENRKDQEYMERALSLAIKGGGYVNPNPQVGAIVVNDGRVVGEGFHREFGAPHAEVEALEDAGPLAKDATMYVTLEPCVHYGKTPPCVDKIIETGIARVEVATRDPNPKVFGKGIEKMESNGIDVSLGLKEREAKKRNEIYFHYVKAGRPFVLLKLAMTLDGKIATKSGDSHWISSEPAREMVHSLRARYSGVGVGVNTIISDDPRLNVRKADGPDGTRFIFDTRGNTPVNSRIFELESDAPTVVVSGEGLPEADLLPYKNSGAKVWQFPEREGVIDLEAFLKKMGKENYDSLMVEGGSEVAWSFLNQDLVDKILFFYSPGIIGGREAVPSVGGTGEEKVKDAIRIEEMDISRVGDDFSLVGYPLKR
ncbi:MAG: bifunctional diaminohydroxyphosphoribosylaminopyrimidine deaminase/5-amino-6-(5-phosphoribosylamino)uracil reductase RibD [Candidatus Bipolaricaulota bacterium]